MSDVGALVPGIAVESLLVEGACFRSLARERKAACTLAPPGGDRLAEKRPRHPSELVDLADPKRAPDPVCVNTPLADLQVGHHGLTDEERDIGIRTGFAPPLTQR